MDEILGTETHHEDDYYVLLGCDELSSSDQIKAEFKIRALEVHPDKHPNDPQAVEKFQKLQTAKETLTDMKLREQYDRWRRSGLTIPYETWRSMTGAIHTTLHWAVKKKKEPMLEDGSQQQTQDPTNLSHNPSSASSGPSQYASFPSSWSHDSGDDVLQKFRSYQI